jgi:Major Facilitator Superfamily/SPX domain
MVEFGKTLEESKRPEWSSYYLDYGRLKNILQKINAVTATGHRRSYSQSLLMSTLESPSTTNDAQMTLQLGWMEFRRILDQEIEKVVLFSLQEQGRMAEELSRLAQSKQQCLEHVSNLWQHYVQANPDYGDQIASQIRDLYRRHQSMAHHVLDYVSFCELNVTAVRKILKKHDKLHPRETLTQAYVNTFVSQTMDSHLHQLYNYGGLSAIVASLTRAFDQLQLAEALVLAMMKGGHPTRSLPQNSENRRHRVRSMPLFPTDLEMEATHGSTFAAQQQALILNSSLAMYGLQPPPTLIANADQPSTSRNMLHFPTNHSTSAVFPPLLSRFTPPFHEPLLDQIQAARSRLQQSTKYVELIAAKALIFADDDDIDDKHHHHAASPDTEAEVRRRKRLSSLLNLASTFFYMTNYYIVAPTTGQYAIQVGSSEALAGIIIGMTPNAALIATVLYGWWSNYAYKSALLFAAASSLIGNLCYALALRHHSIHLVMLGRFLNGFGSARSINRRYIADTFSRAERTAESAAFVTAGAMGMAAGPAIAALLGVWFRHFPPNNLIWTVETAPGWVMLILWLVYFVTTLLYFEEPDRSHLFSSKYTWIQSKVDSPQNDETQETKPLLSSSNKDTEHVAAITVAAIAKKPLPLYRNVPVMLTLWLYFVLKLVLECLLSSCATLTGFFFGWDSQHKGTFLAFLGGLMIPVNMVVAKLSQNYEDRELILGTLLIMFLSSLGILDYKASSASSYSIIQYVTVSICLFVSANVLEGPNMGLLSKTIPKNWARGTFNSGFLATEAGTAARSIGNILVSVAATFYGVQRLLNATFIPIVILVGLSTWCTHLLFDHLVEDDEDDEDNNARPATP